MSTASVLPFTPATDLLTEIAARREARLASKATQYARTVPIASDIDPDSCLRRQVLEIVAWKDKPLVTPKLQARFDVGNLHENEAIIGLKRDGFDVLAEQEVFELRHRKTQVPVARGRIDGKIRWIGKLVPFEVKTMDPNVYARIDTLEDLKRFWWTSKYVAQLMSYLIGHGHEWGFFLLTDMKGNWKTIRVEIDYAFAERIWAFAEFVVDAVEAYRIGVAADRPNELPRYSSDPVECTRCPFFGRTCNPDIVEQGASMLEDPELEVALARWFELRDGAKEYEGLDKRIKTRIKAASIEKGIAGNFAITVTERAVKAYTVPARTDKVVSISPLIGAAAEGQEA